MKKIFLIALLILFISIQCFASGATEDFPIPVSRHGEMIGEDTARVFSSPKYYKTKDGELLPVESNYLNGTVREKAVAVLALSDNDEYMTLTPDECYGLSESDPKAEYMKWELEDYIFDGVSSDIITNPIMQESSAIHDLGAIKIYGISSLNRQLVPWPDSAKSGVITFKVYIKGLRFVHEERSDTYRVESINTGDFRFRINKPIFVGSDYIPLTSGTGEFYNIIDHTLTDNHDGSWTYKKITKDLSNISIPPGSYIDAETVYSDSGDGFTNAYSTSSWSAARTASSANTVDTTAASGVMCRGELRNGYYYCVRTFLKFPTSGFTGTATAASVYLTSKETTWRKACEIQEGTQGSPLTVGDHLDYVGASFAYSAWANADTEFSFSLNAAGLTVINDDLGGDLLYCVRNSAQDYYNATPVNGQENRSYGYYSESTGSNVPYIVITGVAAPSDKLDLKVTISSAGDATDLLDLKTNIQDGKLDLKVYIHTATTHYVRPSGGSYGNEDGTTYADAWSGWDDVDWDVIYDTDTIEDYALEPYKLDQIQYTGSGVTIRGHGTWNGATTIDNADWVQVGATNVWKVAITPKTTIDYYQYSVPASPTVGEIWFNTGSEGTAVQYDSSGYWSDVAYFRKPNMLWVDGVYTYPVITDGGAVDTMSTAYMQDTAYDGVDNYWRYYDVWCKYYPYWWGARRIASSTDLNDQINFEPFPGSTGTPESYIIGNINEISAEYEWGYDNAEYLYMWFDSDPTSGGPVVEYADNGVAIILMRCKGITLTGYDFEKMNDAPIKVRHGINIIVDNNDFDEIWCNNFLDRSGVIYIEHTYTTGNKVTNNQISNVRNGAGIWAAQQDDMEITGNDITNVGDTTWTAGQPNGIHFEKGNNLLIQNNYFNTVSGSGIIANYISESLIDSNVLYHTMDEFIDGGAIYNGFRDLRHDSDCSATTKGNTFSNNRIEFTADQSSVRGIYLDWGTNNNMVEDNILYAISGLATDTYTNRAIFENWNGSEFGDYACPVEDLNNQAEGNLLYDNDVTMLYSNDYDNNKHSYLSGSPTPGTTTWPNGVADAYGNTRYAESTYAFVETLLLDLKVYISEGIDLLPIMFINMQ